MARTGWGNTFRYDLPIPPSYAPREGLLVLLGRTAKIGIIALGLATALGAMPVNVSALVAGLGLTGFALGFAFRDVLSNLVADIPLLLFSVTGLEGEVVNIDLRYTVLKQPDKTVLIPKSYLFTNPILVQQNVPQAETTKGI